MNGDTGGEASRDNRLSEGDHPPSRDDEGVSGGTDTIPLAPRGAADVFGDRLPLATRYVEFLATAGLERGLMGPRERPRLWDRHVLNSAAAASHFGHSQKVVDIGSGAGLPGIPLALARPDLTITLVEPLLRRVIFLEEIIGTLGIDVRVVRGRAEEASTIAEAGGAHVVTSRAVAPLAKLARWSAPLLNTGGRMVALKGESAQDEVERDRAELEKLGFTDVHVETVSAPDADPTRLVIGTLETRIGIRGSRSRGGGRRNR